MNFNLKFLSRSERISLSCRDCFNLRILHLVSQTFDSGKSLDFCIQRVRILEYLIIGRSFVNDKHERLEARFLDLTDFGKSMHLNFVPFLAFNKEFDQSGEYELLEERNTHVFALGGVKDALDLVQIFVHFIFSFGGVVAAKSIETALVNHCIEMTILKFEIHEIHHLICDPLNLFCLHFFDNICFEIDTVNLFEAKFSGKHFR